MMGTVTSLRNSSVRRSGLTLIELLVTIGVIGILFSLLLPAISSARRTAHKTQCISHLRQIGQALSAYESAQGALPDVYFHHQLLPHIGQQPLWEEMDVGRELNPVEMTQFSKISISLFQCPVDPAPAEFEIAVFDYEDWKGPFVATGTNYVGNLNWYRPAVDTPLEFSDLIRGQSNSVLVSETLRPDAGLPRMRTVWQIPITDLDRDRFHSQCTSLPLDPKSHGYRPVGYRGTPWHGLGRTGVATFYDHLLPPNRPNCEATLGGYQVFPAMSMHSGGVNTLFADGHVEFESQSIDRMLWLEMGRLSSDSLLEGYFLSLQ